MHSLYNTGCASKNAFGKAQMYYNFASSGKYTGIFPNLPKIDIMPAPLPMPNTKKYVATV